MTNPSKRFCRLPPCLMCNKGLGRRARILLCLGYHANPQGTCWPEMRKIEEETGIDLHDISTTINQLEAEGCIAIDRSGDNYVYHLLDAGSEALVTGTNTHKRRKRPKPPTATL